MNYSLACVPRPLMTVSNQHCPSQPYHFGFLTPSLLSSLLSLVDSSDCNVGRCRLYDSSTHEKEVRWKQTDQSVMFLD